MGLGPRALHGSHRSRRAPRPAEIELLHLRAMKPDEVHALPAWCLRLIILVEARAAPRLRTVEGLWRKSTRTRPGRMTDFIRAEARSEEHTSDLQSLMRISYAVFCLKQK